MFFDGSVRSTRTTSFSGRLATISCSALRAPLALRQLVELRRVDGDRRRDGLAPLDVLAEQISRTL